MGNIDWVDQSGTPGLDTLTDYQNYGVRAREKINPWENGEIIIGMDLDYISGEVDLLDPLGPDNRFPEETFRISSPYGALSHLFGEREGYYIIPSIGARYMNHSYFDNEIAPQAGLVMGYKETRLHTSYGKGINFPGLYARVQEVIFLPGNNQCSQLDAEQLDHYEAGIAYSFNRACKADLIWFYDKGKDRIVVSPPPPFPPVLTNIGEYRHRGLEGSITVAPCSGFTFFGGFTYLDTEPSDLPYSPKWTFSSGINYLFF